VPCTPTFLGSFLQAQARSTYKRPPRSYKLPYPRNPFTRARIRLAIKALRYGPYKFSINKISGLLKISTRTVFQHLEQLRKDAQRFYAGRAHYRRSKNCPGIVTSKGFFISLSELSRRLKAFNLGLIDTIEEALGEDPP
jgi:Predicted transcriptional regulator